MIRALRVQGYRCFSDLEVQNLGRVNLFVGTNNSGKTSLLEAVRILSEGGNPELLLSILSRRGESLPNEAERTRSGSESDVRHLFGGHEPTPGSTIRIESRNNLPKWVELELIERSERPLFSEDEVVAGPYALRVRRSGSTEDTVVPLTRRGGFSFRAIDRIRPVATLFDDRPASQFISAGSVTAEYIATNWPSIALNPEEELVLQALRILDKDIERIAYVGTERTVSARSRGGIVLKRKGSDRRIPIGSMGDGMWRMLALAIALTRSENSVLLVDEIDTGLHYTVMADMWRMIADTAKSLQVQVFATTHSNDCVQSLASICDPSLTSGSDVTLHRVESDHQYTTEFLEREITIAQERNIEVR